jgi:hypothetical protein
MFDRMKIALETFDSFRSAPAAACLAFFAAELHISPAVLQAMAELIALPSNRSSPCRPTSSARWPRRRPLRRLPGRTRGVFFGYDFHLTETGPRLIEINTNAGGGLLNAYLLADAAMEKMGSPTARAGFRRHVPRGMALERGDAPLKRIAIVDETRPNQFLAPEFELFRQLFEANGIAAVVADPGEFTATAGACCIDGEAGRPDLQPTDRFFTGCYGQRQNSGGFRCRRCGADAASARPRAVCRQAQPDAALGREQR